jgi:hypothetical protein
MLQLVPNLSRPILDGRKVMQYSETKKSFSSNVVPSRPELFCYQLMSFQLHVVILSNF